MKRQALIILILLVVAFAGNASAIDIIWTEANGVNNTPYNDWHDPCNWDPAIVPGSGDPCGANGYLNQSVKIKWASYYNAPSASGPIVRDDIGTIAYLKPGTGSSTVVPMMPAVCLFRDGGRLVTSNRGTLADRGVTQIGQSTGCPGTIEMTGGYSGHGRVLQGRRALGVIKLWHDDVNDPGGDPCLCTGVGGGAADIKLGNAQSGTGQARIYILDGMINTPGMSWFTGESYMNIERGILETGGDTINMPTGGSTGTDAERIEWLYTNFNPDPDFRNPEGGQLKYLECYAGSGMLNYEVGPILPFSSGCPYIQDYHPERPLAAGWIRVWCLPPPPPPVLPSPKDNETGVSKYAKKCPEALPLPASLAKRKLIWNAPINSAAHYNVYLGTNEDDVDNGTGGTDMGIVDVNNYTPTDLLLSTEYFWRIEPLDAGYNSKGHGYVWSFEMSHCLCIDDFESYSFLPAGVWWYGGGADGCDGGIGLNALGGHDNAYGGTKAMKINYIAPSPPNTEAYWTPVLLKDWTVGGQANSLSLWYKAKPSAESIYVRLTDISDTAKVVDLAAALDDCWHEAIVPYTSFEPGNVDVNNVMWLDIGISGSPVVGETALIDDIGLCEPRCFPDNTLPGDLDGDCDVDGADLAELADQWLQAPGIPSADIEPPPTGDNIVNFLDFAKLAEDWLEIGLTP